MPVLLANPSHDDLADDRGFREAEAFGVTVQVPLLVVA
jgi:hypothetical protein